MQRGERRNARPMFIGILQFELLIPGAGNLKDKRRVVRSLKDRLHREHQVSVAEIGALDVWTVAEIGLSVTAGTAARAGEVLDAVLLKIRGLHDAELGPYLREVVKNDAMLDRAIEPDGARDADESAVPFTEAERAAAESILRESTP